MRELAFPDEPEMHTRRIAIGESDYRYYSHSGCDEVVEYRRLAEAWLSEYPEDHLRGFLRRFRGKDARGHASAFFELFLHERLRVLCDELEVEGAIPDSGKRADFVLHYSDGSALAVEALSLEQVGFATDPNVERVLEWIRQLTSRDFAIHFGKTEGHLSSSPKRLEVQGWANRVLSKYRWEDAYEAVGRTDHPFISVKALKLGDWSVQAELWVKPPEHRTETSCFGSFGGHEQSFGYYDVPAELRDRIRMKISSKKADRSSVPFILAVNVEDHLLRPAEEELEILHGFKHRIRFTTATRDDQVVERDAQGTFSPDGTEGVWSTSDNRGQYGRCGAIWFFHQVGIVHPRGSRRALYLNPFVPHDFKMLALHHFATADVGLPD